MQEAESNGKNFTSGDIKAYFNMYDGSYSHYDNVVEIAYWPDWVDKELSEADQARSGSSSSPPTAGLSLQPCVVESQQFAAQGVRMACCTPDRMQIVRTSLSSYELSNYNRNRTGECSACRPMLLLHTLLGVQLSVHSTLPVFAAHFWHYTTVLIPAPSAQALFQLNRSEDQALVMPTLDITTKYSQTTGT